MSFHIYKNLQEAQLSLALLRVCFFSVVWYFTYPQDLLSSVHNPSELWLPQGIFTLFSEPIFFSQRTASVLEMAWHFLALACILGFLFRISSLGFLALTFFMHNLSHSYGYQTHTFMPLILVIAILAASPAGENFSVDRFLKKKEESDLKDYDLTVFACRMVFCLVFFSAGLSKIKNSGLDWITSDQLQNILIQSRIFFPDVHQWAGSWELSLHLAQYPILCKFLAAGVILIELLAPMALFSSRARLPIVLCLLFAQIGFYFFLLVNFRTYLALYLVWIPWSWMAKKRSSNH